MVLELVAPLAFKSIVDAITSSPVPSWSVVRIPFAYLASILIATWFLYRVMSVVMTRAVVRVSEGTRTFLFSRTTIQSARLFSDVSSGRILTMIQDFSQVLTSFIEFGVYQIIPFILFVVWFAVILLGHSPVLTLAFVIYVILTIAYQFQFAKRWRVMREKIVEKRIQAAARLADATGNLVTTKVFAMERQESNEMRKAHHAVTKAEFSAVFKEEVGWGLQMGLMIIFEIILLGGMLYKWSIGESTLGDVIITQGYLAFLYTNLQGLARIFRKLPAMLADAAPGAGLLNDEPDVIDAFDAKTLRVPQGEIEFAHLKFGYEPKRLILKDFSLTIKPKEKVAFVGLSGAGKSTIIKLLYRFYDPQSGEIRIDGTNIATVTQESLRRSLALVPQDPALFHRSLLENIKYARPNASKKEVMQAAKRAHCDEFIKQLEHGYDSLVGDRGVKLSGGERQRVALARAILADAPILVLDEATSSLDSASEGLIKDALHQVMKDKTVLVIAHRLSTIREMDRIVVLEKGKIVAEGTHDELITQGGTYAHLWNLQVGGFLPEEES